MKNQLSARYQTTKWKIAQWTEIRWWKNYLGKRSIQDYLATKTAYWQRFLQENHIHLPDNHTILDAGCGPAGIFTAFPNHPVTAIDPLLSAYQREFPLLFNTYAQNVRFENASLEEYTPASQYDHVFCLNAINHVKDIHLAMDHLVNALQPNGFLYLTIDVHKYETFKYLFQYIPGDFLHPHQYGLQDYVKLLTDRGCHLLQAKALKTGLIFDYYLILGHKSLK